MDKDEKGFWYSVGVVAVSYSMGIITLFGLSRSAEQSRDKLVSNIKQESEGLRWHLVESRSMTLDLLHGEVFSSVSKVRDESERALLMARLEGFDNAYYEFSEVVKAGSSTRRDGTVIEMGSVDLLEWSSDMIDFGASIMRQAEEHQPSWADEVRELQSKGKLPAQNR